jgi:hypothetical protein
MGFLAKLMPLFLQGKKSIQGWVNRVGFAETKPADASLYLCCARIHNMV